MSSRKHLGIAMALSMLVLSLGVLLLVWPAYRETVAIDREITELRRKGRNYDQQIEMIAALSSRLREETRRAERDLKIIPPSPDVAGLMQVLTVPVDGVTVHDHTLKVGERSDAAPGRDAAMQVTPLTVELEARFDAVYDLIRAAESVDRLVRVRSLTLVADRSQAPPVARASIVLEAVFDPPAPEES